MADRTATATEILRAAESAVTLDSSFVAMMESFIKRWRPVDPHESARFDAELMGLLRRLWIDADTPNRRMVDRMVDAFSLASTTALGSTFVRDPSAGTGSGEGHD